VPDDPTRGPLIEGAQRSLEACSIRAPEPRYLVIWRRHKWTILGIGLFLLLDLVVGIAAGVGGVRH
jgi:hypothetical protein